jgi:hypothetical protein
VDLFFLVRGAVIEFGDGLEGGIHGSLELGIKN